MTQTLAAGRFSKEYISQIERGKTRPTEETIAGSPRLGTDRAFLQHGISTVDSVRAESLLERSESLSEQHRYAEAVDGFRAAAAVAGLTAVPSLALRSLVGEAWAHSQQGEIDEALGLLERARELADEPTLSDVERADVLFRIGVCRYKQSRIAEALALFRRALQLVARSVAGCGGFARTSTTGARCYRLRVRRPREDIARARAG
jgi:tetratricopeptide (TPR) repeat protein